jgi:hypothetical protein
LACLSSSLKGQRNSTPNSPLRQRKMATIYAKIWIPGRPNGSLGDIFRKATVTNLHHQLCTLPWTQLVPTFFDFVTILAIQQVPALTQISDSWLPDLLTVGASLPSPT